MAVSFPKKAPRNRTIDFDSQEGKQFLDLCLSPEDVKKDPERRDVTILGDTFETLSALPSNFVDLLIVDPPYNREKVYGSSAYRRRPGREYVEFTRSWISALRHTLRDSASVYVCSDWQSSLLIAPVLTEFFTIHNRITWQREKGRGSQKNWKNSHEDIWFCSLGDQYTYNANAVKLRRRVLAPYRQDGVARDWSQTSEGKFRDTFASNFWDDVTIPFWSMPENTAHPTQKSEKMLAKMILASSSPGDVVLDPFAGSGSTSVVAKKLGRHYVGIEREPQYCAWAEYRIARADLDPSIQGYRDGVFWERNSSPRHGGVTVES